MGVEVRWNALKALGAYTGINKKDCLASGVHIQGKS